MANGIVLTHVCDGDGEMVGVPAEVVLRGKGGVFPSLYLPWDAALLLAEEYGWEPYEYRGHYRSCGAEVDNEDAWELSAALKAALSAGEWPDDGDDLFGGWSLLPREGVRQLAEFCYAGAFRIEAGPGAPAA
jgi:hypothetical protein